MRFNFWVIFFFPMTGDSYWVFDAERKITGPDSVRQLGLPVSDIHAALKWEDNRIEKVYLFKSYSYWPFSLQENRVEDVHPRSMHKWEGVPSHIDAAFRDRYGKDWELGKATCWLSYLCSLADCCLLLPSNRLRQFLEWAALLEAWPCWVEGARRLPAQHWHGFLRLPFCLNKFIHHIHLLSLWRAVGWFFSLFPYTEHCCYFGNILKVIVFQ